MRREEEGGGIVELSPKILETAKLAYAMHGNKATKIQDGRHDRHLGFSIFEILLNIETFC